MARGSILYVVARADRQMRWAVGTCGRVLDQIGCIGTRTHDSSDKANNIRLARYMEGMEGVGCAVTCSLHKILHTGGSFGGWKLSDILI